MTGLPGLPGPSVPAGELARRTLEQVRGFLREATADELLTGRVRIGGDVVCAVTGPAGPRG